MFHRRFVSWVGITVFMVTAFAQTPAPAQEPAEFFRGKTITVYVAIGSGAYDLYTRVLVRHLPRHLPGNPTIIVNNMPGAGGVKAVNYVAHVAPADGTALLVPLKPVAMAQVLRPEGVRYDASKFNWIGSMVDAPGVFTAWHTAPVDTLEDVRRREVLMAGSGVGAETFIFPTVVNSVLGTRFRVVTGYKGMSDMLLAVERGEVHGVSTVYGSLQGLKPDWLAEKKVKFIAQIATERSADLPTVPTVLEFAKTAEDREVLLFLTLSNTIGRSITAPPEIPSDRLAALRKAFDDTVRDPAYLNEAKERGMQLNPTPGVRVQEDVNRLIAMPQSTVDKVKAALAAGPSARN